MSKPNETTSFLTYEEAANVIGVSPKSISGFAKKHNVSRGSLVIGGRNRRVVSESDFMSVVKSKNYNRENDAVVWD
jgi:hypothetical protein|tara:strand:- start:45 stop:272 length:228 start_codon:yes stop_codon:yes gene_type:complete